MAFALRAGMRPYPCFAVAVAIGVTALAAAPQPAHACTWPMPTTFEVDPDLEPGGTTPPKPAAEATTSVHTGGGCTPDECDGQTLLYILIEDDYGMSSIDDMGFEITPRDGASALPFEGPVRAYYIDDDGYAVIYVAFDDTRSNLGSLEIVAIDRAGNRSEPTTVRIRGEGGGCRAASGSTSSWLLILLALLAVTRSDLAVRRLASRR